MAQGFNVNMIRVCAQFEQAHLMSGDGRGRCPMILVSEVGSKLAVVGAQGDIFPVCCECGSDDTLPQT
jgi:hypothetical protein